jgi:pimeloyl-ACP methyl ester carboxylesterase
MRLLPIALVLACLIAAAPARASLHWRDCGDGFQCATAKVPLDYAKPHGPKIGLPVLKHPALDQAHRIGSLFLNPGGPGGSGIAFVRQAPPQAFQVLPKFDWIGWDPRGVGGDIDCDEPPPYEAMTPDTFDLHRLLDRGRALSRLCLNRDPRFLASLNTGNAARDLDRLRAGVGDKQLTFIGLSWGGMLAETYTSLFPGRARALLLDSPVDGDVWLNHGLQARTDQLVGFERSLGRFLAASHIPADDLDAQLARLAEHPIDLGDGRSLDDGDLRLFLFDGLYSRSSWPALAAGLAAVQAEDIETLRLIDDAASAFSSQQDVFHTYVLVERHYPRRVAPYVRNSERVFNLAPHFAPGAYDVIEALFWPVRARGAFYGPYRHDKRSTPALVLHTTHDPAAPGAWGRHVVRDLGNARLLTYNGDGHGVIPDFNACVFAAIVPYLEALKLPPEGAGCDQVVSSSHSSSSVRSSTPAAWMRAAYSRRVSSAIGLSEASSSAKPVMMVSGERRSWRRR